MFLLYLVDVKGLKVTIDPNVSVTLQILYETNLSNCESNLSSCGLSRTGSTGSLYPNLFVRLVSQTSLRTARTTIHRT